MKRWFAVFAFALTLAAPALAVVYGFDDRVDPDGTPVASCTVDGVLVTMSVACTNPLSLRTYEAADWVAFLGASAHNTPLVPGDVSYDRFISSVDDADDSGLFVAAQPIVFVFDRPVSRFELTTLDLLEYGSGLGAHVEMTAYDGEGTQLDRHERTGEFGSSGLALRWEVEADGILRVELTGEEEAGKGGFGIDDLLVDRIVATEASSWSAVKALYR